MTQHVAAEFKTSSLCSGGDCAEVGMRHGGVVAVRDTKDRSRELRFSSQEWAAFVAEIKGGELSRVLSPARSPPGRSTARLTDRGEVNRAEASS